jgi:hypothetical protein
MQRTRARPSGMYIGAWQEYMLWQTVESRRPPDKRMQTTARSVLKEDSDLARSRELSNTHRSDIDMGNTHRSDIDIGRSEDFGSLRTDQFSTVLKDVLNSSVIDTSSMTEHTDTCTPDWTLRRSVLSTTGSTTLSGFTFSTTRATTPSTTSSRPSGQVTRWSTADRKSRETSAPSAVIGRSAHSSTPNKKARPGAPLHKGPAKEDAATRLERMRRTYVAGARGEEEFPSAPLRDTPPPSRMQASISASPMRSPITRPAAATLLPALEKVSQSAPPEPSPHERLILDLLAQQAAEQAQVAAALQEQAAMASMQSAPMQVTPMWPPQAYGYPYPQFQQAQMPYNPYMQPPPYGWYPAAMPYQPPDAAWQLPAGPIDGGAHQYYHAQQQAAMHQQYHDPYAVYPVLPQAPVAPAAPVYPMSTEEAAAQQAELSFAGASESQVDRLKRIFTQHGAAKVAADAAATSPSLLFQPAGVAAA